MSYCPSCAEKDKLIRAQRDEIARLDKEWRKECADADNILFASGLGEDQWRTDGGSLHVPRIVNHFTDLRHRAERAEAERDALRADAERINWCEKQWADGIHIEYCAIGIGDIRVIPAGAVFLRNKEYKGDSIRAAIDAAIAKGKG